jgi:hypothetical protein
VKRREEAREEKKKQNILPRPRPPPPQTKQRNRRRHANRIIHILARDRLDGREEEHDADEDDPSDGDVVDGLAPPAHRVGALDEVDSALVHAVRDDDRDVAQVERGRGDVEDGDDGLLAADPDHVQACAEGDYQPDRVYGRACQPVDARPESSYVKSSVRKNCAF